MNMKYTNIQLLWTWCTLSCDVTDLTQFCFKATWWADLNGRISSQTNLNRNVDI